MLLYCILKLLSHFVSAGTILCYFHSCLENLAVGSRPFFTFLMFLKILFHESGNADLASLGSLHNMNNLVNTWTVKVD